SPLRSSFVCMMPSFLSPGPLPESASRSKPVPVPGVEPELPPPALPPGRLRAHRLGRLHLLRGKLVGLLLSVEQPHGLVAVLLLGRETTPVLRVDHLERSRSGPCCDSPSHHTSWCEGQSCDVRAKRERRPGGWMRRPTFSCCRRDGPCGCSATVPPGGAVALCCVVRRPSCVTPGRGGNRPVVCHLLSWEPSFR